MFILIIFGFMPSVEAQSFDLKDCFKRARDQSSTIAISQDQIDQTDAQIEQAQSHLMPVLSLQASTMEQDQSMNPLANSLSSTRQSSTNINLSQNLFQGFRDTNLIKQRKKIKQGREWSRKQAIQQIYKDVAQAFYSILLFQTDINQYREQKVSTIGRKNELMAAKKSGRARDSDILLAESSLAGLDAAISRTESSLVTYQEALTYLTGLKRDVILRNTILFPAQLTQIEPWLEALNERPDVRESQSNLQAAEDGISVAQADYYPTLGLSANYYLSRPTGIYQGVDWDTSLTLSFPFFSGGLTRAQVREAHLVHHSNEVRVKQAQELAIQTVTSSFRLVSSDFDQLKNLSHAADLSQKSYNLVHRDNRLGIATNTDVLNAFQVWQESKRNLERTKIIAVSDYVKLLIESSKMIIDGKNLEGDK